MRVLIVKVVVVCLAAVTCGAIAGVLFSLCYYAFVPEERLADVLSSDTYAKMSLRFWAAFCVGAIFGGVWVYRAVRGVKGTTCDFGNGLGDKPVDRTGIDPHPREYT